MHSDGLKPRGYRKGWATVHDCIQFALKHLNEFVPKIRFHFKSLNKHQSDFFIKEVDAGLPYASAWILFITHNMIIASMIYIPTYR